MTLRKLLTRPLPAPPSEAPTANSLVEQFLGLPPLVPLRLFWDSFLELRPWWPVLIPALLWVGIRAYRRERAALREG